MYDLVNQFKEMVLSNFISEQKKRKDISIEEKCKNTFDLTVFQLEEHKFPYNEEDIKEEIQRAFGVLNNMVVIDDGYHPWLDDIKTEIDWVHRNRYYQFLRDYKKWSVSTIHGSIDTTTDIVLDHMGNPKSGAEFLKHGLVIGDVQSGKTANYIGLINKAFDVGYQLIIVLAGMQNDLRSQTQERIDREVLGYETSLNNPLQNGERIGVGILPGAITDIESLTSRGGTGDYKKTNGVQIFNNNSTRKIAVVKKNTTVLKNLYEDLSSEINLVDGKFNIPVLIIDDEMDQASVNTKKDIETDPTAINGHIRKLLNLCRFVSYVGYTATPYANIMIQSDLSVEKYGQDLFPKDFVICLPKPNGYCGVDEFFGTKENPNHTLVVNIDDYSEFDQSFIYNSTPEEYNQYMEFSVRADSQINNLPGSLKNAIKDYIVASAIKRVREGGPTHNGMIINIAQYTLPSKDLSKLVEEYLDELSNQFFYERDEALKVYKEIFDSNFVEISKQYNREDDWQEVQKEIKNVFELNKVILLNGESKDTIDYTQKNQSQIIAIGGNKLSRGITIEGLMITYYLRKPKAYDTAFQMGRWFGYKSKYLDLCRVYAPERAILDFVHMMDATNELKQEISEMNERKLSPRDFGLRVKSSTSMLPTALNKMGGGSLGKIDCAGSKKETTVFTKEYIQDNFELADQFISKLKDDGNVEFELVDDIIPVFHHCKANQIKDLLRNYKEPLEIEAKMKKCLDYIEEMNKVNELTDWTVVVSTLKNKKTNSAILGGFEINNPHRGTFDSQGLETRIISNPADDSLMIRDLEKRKEYRAGIKLSDAIYNEVFTKDRGLLVINCLDLGPKEGEKEIVVNSNVIGLTLRFPNTDQKPSTYLMNDVYKREIQE